MLLMNIIIINTLFLYIQVLGPISRTVKAVASLMLIIYLLHQMVCQEADFQNISKETARSQFQKMSKWLVE